MTNSEARDLKFILDAILINHQVKKKQNDDSTNIQKIQDDFKVTHTRSNDILRLNQLLSDLGLIDSKSQENELDETDDDYQDHVLFENVNIDVYKKIIPFCQIAFLYEQTGNAENHARKLATIFDTDIEVMTYLDKYLTAKYNRSALSIHNFVHDACSFDLPPVKDCHFTFWKKLAKASENRLVNIGNDKFRTVLVNAPVIEKTINDGIEKNPHKKFTQEELSKINTLKESISLKSKEYNKEKTKESGNLTYVEKMQRQKNLIALKKKISESKLTLAAALMGQPLEKMDIDSLQAFYESYQVNNKGYLTLVKYGMSDRDIKVFHSLKRDNDDFLIPNETLDGSDIGYKGYYLKKLDTISDHGAAIGACLGKITPCCQYLGGAGNDCAIYGITSKYSGFYLLCKGDAKNPSLDDEIMASSWVWRGKDDTLCFDSIERTDTADKHTIADMFRYFSHQLCTNKYFQEKYHIKRINTGNNSGVTKKVGTNDCVITKSYIRDYTGYSDANTQLSLANTTTPYLFHSKIKSKELNKKLEDDIKEYFASIANDPIKLKDNKKLKNLITFALENQNSKLLVLIENLVTHRKEELEGVINANKEYIDELNNKIIDISLFEKGANPDAKNDKGETSLHLAVSNNDIELINTLLKHDANPDIKNIHGYTALYIAIQSNLYNQKNMIGREIAMILINAHADLDFQYYYSEISLLHIAVQNNDIDMVKYLVKYGAFLEVCGHDATTPLYQAAEKGYVDIFNFLLSEGADPAACNYRDDSMLICAVKNNNLEILKTILNSKKISVNKPNLNGHTPLYLAIESRNIEVINLLISNNASFPDTTNAWYLRTLENFSSNPELLKKLFSLIPINKRFDIIMATNSIQETILHKAANNHELLETVFSLLPKNKQLQAMKMQNHTGETILHLASDNPESLKMLLSLFPENQRLELMMANNGFSKKTVLHRAAMNAESLITLLSLLPEGQRINAVKMLTAFGKTVLHLAALNPQSLKVILSNLPEHTRLQAMIIRDNDGETALHKAVEEPESLKILLSLLPIEQRLTLVMANNYTFSCNTALHLAVKKNPSLVHSILSFLPEDQRLDALMKKNGSGKTTLHYLTKNKASLISLLSLLPSERNAYKSTSDTKSSSCFIEDMHNKHILSSDDKDENFYASCFKEVCESLEMDIKKNNQKYYDTSLFTPNEKIERQLINDILKCNSWNQMKELLNNREEKTEMPCLAIQTLK